MSRSARRRRSRKVAAQYRANPFALPVPAIAVGLPLDENPNRGKRGAARLDFMGQTIAQLEREESEAYAPLTVATPVRDSLGRRNPRMGYTVYTV